MNLKTGSVIFAFAFIIVIVTLITGHFIFGELSVPEVALLSAPIFLFAILFTLTLNRLVLFLNQSLKGEKKDCNFAEFTSLSNQISTLNSNLQSKDIFIDDVMKSSVCLLISWKKNGEIIGFNDAALNAYGFLESGQPYQSINDFMNNHADYVAQKVIDDAAIGKSTFGYETIIHHSEGRQVIIWDVVPYAPDGENIEYVIACGLDTTKHRNAERRLRLSAQLFESTIEAVMITDDKGDLIDVNHAFVETTGFARNEVIGRNPKFMLAERHDEIFYDSIWDNLLNDGSWRGVIWGKRKNGEEFPKQLSFTESRNANGNITNFIGVFSDISEKMRDQEKLQQLAHYDSLTSLPNRVLFNDRLYSALARSKREQDMMCLMFIDLDRFKQVNDTLGHRIGDELLKEVSKRLVHSVREVDTVSRLSGDEFTVILTDLITEEDIEMVASRIVKSVGAPYFIEGHELFISTSVGISIFPNDGDNAQDLLRNSDLAMYHAKSLGRNNCQYYKAGMNKTAKNELSLANKLRIAINRDEVIPHYQLKVDCVSGFPVGMEALARWKTDENEFISPARFIPVAEENGLIFKLGNNVLHEVCKQIRMWQDMRFHFESVAINLSAQQFRDANLLSSIREAIEDHRISPDKLEVEVTENTMMEDMDGAKRVLSGLKDLGLSISIDDFGTGYSSLNYLKKFPVDTLKIDRSFVQELTPESDDAAIVSAIISMSEKMNINVVAEGVETKEQIDYLGSIGCRTVQGFYFAKPCSGAEVPIAWSRIAENFGEKVLSLS